MKITTTTQGELKGDIGDSNTQLLTIVIPFDFSGVDVSSVMILRQHGTDGAEQLTKNPAAGQEGFTVNATEGTITIYAMKFSDYAVAYAEQSTGNTNVASAATGDAGLALYAALSVSSVLGMGWVGKKKRDDK